MSTLIEIKSLSYTPPAGMFEPGNEEILRNISCTINKGEITGIAGESGSGKTTLAKLIAGIHAPSSGKILFDSSINMDKNNVNPVQILFQNSGEILNPYREIFDAVKDFYEARHGRNSAVLDEIKKIMNFVNIPKNLYNKKGMQLSGGEQQRAAIAKIIASKPELMILDEPFSAQDPESRNNLVALFKEINTSLGISILCISHNLQLLKKLCSYIIIMYNGEIVEQGKCEKIFHSPSHPYTKYLSEAENYGLSFNELQRTRGK